MSVVENAILSILALIFFLNHYVALWGISNMIDRESKNTMLDVKVRYYWNNLRKPMLWFTIITSAWGVLSSIFFPVSCIIGLIIADVAAIFIAIRYVSKHCYFSNE